MKSPTKKQIHYLSEIFNHAGAVFLAGVFLAGMVVPILTQNINRYDSNLLIIGFLYTGTCWWIGYKILDIKFE